MGFEVFEIAQQGESTELDKIKKKVFGRLIKLPDTIFNNLEKYKREKNLHTFMGMKQELEKEHIIN